MSGGREEGERETGVLGQGSGGGGEGESSSGKKGLCCCATCCSGGEKGRNKVNGYKLLKLCKQVLLSPIKAQF